MLSIGTFSYHHKWRFALAIDLIYNDFVFDETQKSSEIVRTADSLEDWSWSLLHLLVSWNWIRVRICIELEKEL